MGSFVSPVGRVVSSDTLVGSQTATGDVLVDTSTGAVSLRAQDVITGAPVDVVLAPQGGGVNPGTPGTLPKYDLAGTNLGDSQVREGPKSLALGDATGGLLLTDWSAGASSLSWRDSGLLVPFRVTEAGVVELGVSPSLGPYSAVNFQWRGGTQRADFYLGGGIPAFSVVPGGFQTGNVNVPRLIFNTANAPELTVEHPAFGVIFSVNTGTKEITAQSLAGSPTNHAVVASSGGVLSRANGSTFYPYTANGTDWVAPKPDNVHAALDRMATALAGLLGGPIP